MNEPNNAPQVADTLREHASDVPDDLNLWPAIRARAATQPPFAPAPAPRLRLAFAALALLLVAGGLAWFAFSRPATNGNSPTVAQGGATVTLTVERASPAPTVAAIATALPSPTGNGAPPIGGDALAAIGVSPAPNATAVAPDAPIAITFNHPVDRASAVFSISPPIQGDSRWLDGASNSSTFVFIPRPGYAPATTYRVSLSTTVTDLPARRAAAAVSFQTAPPARVLRTIPADGSNTVATDQRISFQFSAPIIPLTAVSAEQEAGSQISIAPAVAGRFVWLSTTNLELQPAAPLAVGTTYAVTVHKQLTDQFGAQLAADYSFHFSTVSPCVINVYPIDQQAYELIANFYGDQRKDCHPSGANQPSNSDNTVPPTTTLRVAFNYPMNHAAVESAFSVAPLQAQTPTPSLPPAIGTPPSLPPAIGTPDTSQSGPPHTPTILAGATPVSGSFAWAAGDGTTEVMSYTPKSPLALNTRYLVTIGATALPQGGNIATSKDFSWTFTTYAPFHVQYFDAGETPGVLHLDFNNPLDSTTVAGNWSFVPAPPTSTLEVGASSISIRTRLAPSTRYTLTVGSGVKDVAGQSLAQPSVNYLTGPSIGSGNPRPSVNILGTSGYAAFTAAQPTDIYIGSVGGKLLNYGLWRMNADRFAGLTRNNGDGNGIRTVSVGLFLGKPTRSWHQQLAAPPDQPIVTRLPLALDGNADHLPPGYYAFIVELDPYIDSTGRPANHGEASLVFFVGNTSLTLKTTQNEALVWAVNQNSGKPAANLPIVLYSGYSGQVKQIVQGRTDADGLYRVSFEDSTIGIVALAQQPGDAAVVADTWNSNITSTDFTYYRWYPYPSELGESFSANYNYSYISGAYRTYLYTERPIYRPGQTVYFKGIIRADNDAIYSIPRGLQARVTINDGSRDVYSGAVQLSAHGSFSGQYALAPDAHLDAYQLNLTLTDPSQTRDYLRDTQYSYAFTVAEYRKPDYQVTVTTDKQSYISGQTIHTTAAASYYFGTSAVAHAPLTARITAADYFFAWSDPISGAAYDFYDFAQLYAPPAANPTPTPEQQLTTDASGTAQIDTRADLSQSPTSQQYTIEAAVRDASNQEIANRTTVIVHKGEFHVGLHPAAYVAAASQPLTVSLVTVNPDATLRGNQPVSLTLYARTWGVVEETDQSGNVRSVYRPKDTPIETKLLISDAQGRAITAFTNGGNAWAGGEYIVKALAHDGLGNTITAATDIYVAASGFTAWPPRSASVVQLISDKPLYQVGDTARILVTSPYTSATALLTTERAGIRTTRVFRFSSANAVLSIPIDDAALPNLFVSLTLVNSLADGAAAPGFRLGYVELKVDTHPRQLRISLSADKPQYAPGDTASFTIKATDSAGRPATADISFAVVDKAIFALLGDYTPSLLDTFYSERSLGVNTASSLTILAAQNRVYTSYSPPTPVPETVGRGGGDGPQPLVPRSVFSDTAYWQASVHTDASGTATLSFKLPDNTTTWRVNAKAITADTKVGETSAELLVTKPLLVRPLLPRFLLAGDVAQVGATIHNATAAPLSVDVSLTITGSAFLSSTGVITSSDGPRQTAVQHIAVAANSESEVRWPVQASADPRAGFTIAARGSDGSSDAVAIDIPINPLIAPEVTAQSGELAPGGSFVQNVFIPYSAIPNVGQLNVRLNASLASSALDGLAYNVNYLYDCTEQTVSRFLPLLYVEDAFKAAGQKSPYSDQLAAIVHRSLARLYALQHTNGGWGYWEESGGSPDYPYMTAMAVEGLLKAKQAGFSVDQAALDRGINYLKGKLAANNGQDGHDFHDISDPSTRAYVLDVLVTAGDPATAAPLGQLAADQSKLTIFGQAHLVLGLVHSGQQAAAAKASGPLIAKVKLQGSATAHWEADPGYAYYYVNMDSDDRATALAVQAVLAVSPNDELASKAVLWLMQHRSAAGHWASTQETTQATIALARYVAAKHELSANFAYNASFNGATIAGGKFDRTSLTETRRLTVQVKDMLINQPNLLQLSRDQGSGPLYYNAALSYFVPAQGISAYDNGLSVSRSYLPADGAAAKNLLAVITSTTAGSLIHVRLLLDVPQDSYYVTIEDPLPAGMEAINPNLATTSSAAREGAACPYTTPDPYSGTYRQCRAYDGLELHDDRVTYFATFLKAGSYEFDYAMRATTPGSYYAPPARAYLMYSPETWGRSDGGLFTIK